jgi:hypothetical protein
VGGLYYRVQDANSIAHHFVIINGSRPVAEVVRTETADSSEEAVYYFHDDILGSIKAVSDATGSSAVQAQQYGSYGAPTSSGSAKTHFGYTGHEEEAETGLINMNARLFDPASAVGF